MKIQFHKMADQQRLVLLHILCQQLHYFMPGLAMLFQIFARDTVDLLGSGRNLKIIITDKMVFLLDQFSVACINQPGNLD